MFEEVVAWVAEQSGLNIPADQLEFDIYDNPRGQPSCQVKIAYRGPVSPTSGGWPKIKLDLTADERLVLPSVRREVFHPYSDKPEGGIWANCYAYEEAFGEKLRALGERTRPRDLYDVVNLFRHIDSRPTPAVLLDVLRQKCEHNAIPVPNFTSLVPHRQALEAMWSDMLSHQLPVLPPLNDFWDALPEIFNWLIEGSPIPQRAIIQPSANEVSVRTRVLPTGFLSLLARLWKSSVSQQPTIYAWISPTTVGCGVLSRTLCGKLRKGSSYSTQFAVIQANTVPIALTGCKVRP